MAACKVDSCLVRSSRKHEKSLLRGKKVLVDLFTLVCSLPHCVSSTLEVPVWVAWSVSPALYDTVCRCLRLRVWLSLHDLDWSSGDVLIVPDLSGP